MHSKTRLSIICILLAGCAGGPPLSPEAKKIQVHTKPGPLVDKCKTIGPVNVESSSLAGAEVAFEASKNKAREEVARLGGDTLAITNDEINIHSVTPTVRIQGTALKCY